MSSSIVARTSQLSVAGSKERNEDDCGIEIPTEPLLNTKGLAAVIADGMSASEAGQQASRACVQGFLIDYFSTPESWAVKSSAQKVLSALNRWLYSQGQQYGGTRGMVTTLSAMVIKSNTAYLFHIGDTRIYRLRNGELELLTTDHRLKVRGDKTCLTRAMGIELHVDIDYRKVLVEIGDIFLLTTDGIHEFLSDQRLRDILKQSPENLEDVTRRIITEAEQNGSDDNLTCQCLAIEKLPSANEKEFYNKLTELPFPPPLEPGMILDGYRILRYLFANKRTEVYLVQDEQTNNKLVLKAPSVNYDDDPDYINHFLHEEWAGRRINNPHVMKVMEINRPRQCLYYLTEYIEGQSLRQWMNDNPRPKLNQVRDIIEQITKGLRAFHRLEMIHQDLKPENILIDEHGTVKIIDFGSTKIAGIEEIATPLADDNLLGTVNYTAPEYHLGEPVSSRADLFSLAVISYELLTGELPFNKEMLPRNVRRARYVPAKNHVPEIPLWLDKTLEKALSINPQFRYGQLSEFIYDLNHPNKKLLEKDKLPLIKRNPIGFWRGLAIILLLINLFTLYLL